ncbi:hypothetical protein HAX54_020308, partial [Datura stramonium]|nr:hypothetical protein [Datura stramonium]
MEIEWKPLGGRLKASPHFALDLASRYAYADKVSKRLSVKLDQGLVEQSHNE